MKQVLTLILVLIAHLTIGQQKLNEIVQERRIPKSEVTLKIDKSAYTLQAIYRDEVLKSYPCVFGFNPVDDKHQEGDGCTPEGTFKIRSKYAHGSWKYFIWIDYPNKESWRRFNKRKAEGTIDRDATIGGEIGIHGVPEGTDDMIEERTNWTLGCISLTNAAITEIYKSIGPNSKVVIVP